MPAKPDDSVIDPLIAPTSRHRTLRVAMQPKSLCVSATAQVCVARPQEPWLGSNGTLHYARPSQGNVSQPRLFGQDRRYSLSFLPCSRQPRCAQGRAVACLSVKSLYPQAGCLGHPEPGMSIDPAQLNGWRNGWHRIK